MGESYNTDDKPITTAVSYGIASAPQPVPNIEVNPLLTI